MSCWGPARSWCRRPRRPGPPARFPNDEKQPNSADLAREAWAADDPEAGAVAAGPEPSWFFFLALASWADESAANDLAARRLCEALLKRFDIADLKADWIVPARDEVYGAGVARRSRGLLPPTS